jgi:proteic killer suppression protein
MIQSFRDKRVKAFRPFARQAQKRLRILDDAERIEDLLMLPSIRFEALRGDRRGQFSIRIDDRWRICFGFREGDAFDVEITDEHQ